MISPGKILYNESHDIAIAMSSSSRADTDSVLAGGILNYNWRKSSTALTGHMGPEV